MSTRNFGGLLIAVAIAAVLGDLWGPLSTPRTALAQQGQEQGPRLEHVNINVAQDRVITIVSRRGELQMTLWQLGPEGVKLVALHGL